MDLLFFLLVIAQYKLRILWVFSQLLKLISQLFYLNRSQIFAAADKLLGVVATVAIDMLQQRVTKLSDGQRVVIEAVLYRFENHLHIDLIDRGVALECLVDHMERKLGCPGVFDSEALDQLWVDGAGLVPAQHSQQNLSTDLFEVRFVRLKLLQELIVRGKADVLDRRRKLDK